MNVRVVKGILAGLALVATGCGGDRDGATVAPRDAGSLAGTAPEPGSVRTDRATVAHDPAGDPATPSTTADPTTSSTTTIVHATTTAAAPTSLPAGIAVASRTLEPTATIKISEHVDGGLVTADAVWASVNVTDTLYRIDPETNS